jgi:lysophospholipase
MRLFGPCLLALVAACRAPVPLEKQPAFDFVAHPGPDPTSLSSEANILTAWAGPLRAFWDGGEAGHFAGVDGKDIVYRVFRATSAKGAVVVVPGRTESIIKYSEVASDLVQHGYSVYAVELRGQGYAERMLPDHDKGYVAYFDDYVQDTHHFITDVVKPAESHVLLLAHSTGGAMAALLVDQYPDDVAAMAVTSPMLDINLGSFPDPVAVTIAFGQCSNSDGTAYALGSSDFVEETDFSKADVTQSMNRWQWKVNQLHDEPAIRLGGVTWRWLCQALNASNHAQTIGRFSAVPTLVFQAGADKVVHTEGEDKYCTDAPRCTKTRFDDAEHEILQERDTIRNVAVSQTIAFFDAAVTK